MHSAYESTLSFETTNSSHALQILNPELGTLSLWLYKNQLTLNVLKPHYMIFHIPRNFPSDTPDFSFIEKVFEIRCLSVNLNPSLNFSLQNHDVLIKTVQFFPIFYKLKKFLIKNFLEVLPYHLS